MRWFRVGSSHWNANHIQAFSWSNGRLAVWWLGDAEQPETYKDPDGVLYLSLCHALGVAPAEVAADGKGRA